MQACKTCRHMIFSSPAMSMHACMRACMGVHMWLNYGCTCSALRRAAQAVFDSEHEVDDADGQSGDSGSRSSHEDARAEEEADSGSEFSGEPSSSSDESMSAIADSEDEKPTPKKTREVLHAL